MSESNFISHHAVHTLFDATSGPLLIVRKLSTAVRVPEIRTEMDNQAVESFSIFNTFIKMKLV